MSPKSNKKPTSAKKATAKAASQAAESSPLTVGHTLRAARQDKNLSLKEVEETTRVRGKYLVAIETGDYKALPHDVYTKGFIQSYANMLDLDGKILAQRYIEERGDSPQQISPQATGVQTGNALSPRLLTLVGIGVVLVAVVGYLFWQFSSLTAPPKLEVINPDRDQVLYGSLITVNGHVAGGADVFVNDSPILTDVNGNFTDAIALQDGVNAIRVSAKNRLGKTAIVTRSILAHVPKTDPASSLPQAPFDGIAASVQIKDATAGVTIKADGKQIFQGTMLPGTVQTFKAASRLTISTTNAGATIITVTNSTTAAKNLGPVGPMGKAKKDLDFDKDTQFQ